MDRVLNKFKCSDVLMTRSYGVVVRFLTVLLAKSDESRLFAAVYTGRPRLYLRPDTSNFLVFLGRIGGYSLSSHMAATAAAVVAQRRRHEAAEAAANLAEAGTPRPLPPSPKKAVKKIKKVEAKPVLPYQLEVFNFYQNQRVQIFVAVRGPHAAASRHNAPQPFARDPHHCLKHRHRTMLPLAGP